MMRVNVGQVRRARRFWLREIKVKRGAKLNREADSMWKVSYSNWSILSRFNKELSIRFKDFSVPAQYIH
jgi:hypothetical protein